MPGNYIVEYNTPETKEILQRFENADKKINLISEKVKRRTYENINNKYTLTSKLFSKFMYRKQNTWHKNFYTSNKCTSCKICIKLCKFNNINFKNNKPYWGNNCEHCTACINMCPQNAIEYGTKTIKRRKYKNPKVKISDLISK